MKITVWHERATADPNREGSTSWVRLGDDAWQHLTAELASELGVRGPTSRTIERGMAAPTLVAKPTPTRTRLKHRPVEEPRETEDGRELPRYVKPDAERAQCRALQVTLAESVEQLLRAETFNSPGRETGGVLISEERWTYKPSFVAAADVFTADATRGESSLEIGIDQEIIGPEAAWRTTYDHLRCVGYWHSHPMGRLGPSEPDLATAVMILDELAWERASSQRVLGLITGPTKSYRQIGMCAVDVWRDADGRAWWTQAELTGLRECRAVEPIIEAHSTPREDRWIGPVLA